VLLQVCTYNAGTTYQRFYDDALHKSMFYLLDFLQVNDWIGRGIY